MKEIKYQVFHKPTKTIQVVALIDFNNKVLDTYGIDEPIYGIPFTDVEWREYIGRKDKKGVDIYSGDIVQSYLNNSLKVGVIEWVDTYGANGFYFVMPSIGTAAWDKENSEVIANIFENPSLLK